MFGHLPLLPVIFFLCALSNLLILYLNSYICVELLLLLDGIADVSEKVRLYSQLHKLLCHPLYLEIVSFML